MGQHPSDETNDSAQGDYVKFSLPYAGGKRPIEDFEDFRFWVTDQRIRHLGTIERQVAFGFIVLGLVIGIGAFAYLNRTPTRIEPRNDQEAGF